MATPTQVSIEEYLNTSYRPDREYVDGEVRERNVGKWEHARIQWLLAGWFLQHEAEWGVMGSTEQRTRISSARVRVPDLIVVVAGPQPDVIVAPPLLVVEILSPDDTYSETEDRSRDYMNMGVETVWLIDPKTRTGRMCVSNSWTSASRLEVPGTPIYVQLDELFSFLDKPKP
ncbi:MAG TPA: Uma2 family endonuclease [Silvibacterium sp.]|nr:Uma2 family endonuclease [Silvibacterium sp.]